MKRTIKILFCILVIGLSFFLVKTDIEAQQARELELQKQQSEQLQRLDNLENTLDESEKTNTDLNKQIEQKNQENQQKDQQIDELNKQLQAKKAEKARLVTMQTTVRTGNYSGGCDGYRSLFLQYGWDVNVAMAIMQAESGCNPTAVSPSNDHGLMQINKGLAIYGESIYDPAFNIRIAYEQKYLKGGWRHWTVYNSGAYLKYLHG